MPFVQNMLRPLADGAGGFALWHYSAPSETWTALLEPGYFPAHAGVHPQDWVFYSALDAYGRPATGILLALDMGRCATLLCAEQRPPAAPERTVAPGDTLYDSSDGLIYDSTADVPPPDDLADIPHDVLSAAVRLVASDADDAAVIGKAAELMKKPRRGWPKGKSRKTGTGG